MNKSIKNPCVSVGRSGNNKKIIPLFSTPLQLKQIKLKKNKLNYEGSSRCGSAVMNSAIIHKNAGLIPGLTQWIKDPALL